MTSCGKSQRPHGIFGGAFSGVSNFARKGACRLRGLFETRPPSVPIQQRAGCTNFFRGEIAKLQTVDDRFLDPRPVLGAQSWLEIWGRNPRLMSAFDVDVMTVRASPLQASLVARQLNAISRRGYVLSDEAPLVRQLFDLMLWPATLGPCNTRETASRQARRRLAEMHPDHWQHAGGDAVQDTRPYWDLAMAFKTIIEHPISGPPIFGERPALHEFLPACPSPALKRLLPADSPGATPRPPQPQKQSRTPSTLFEDWATWWSPLLTILAGLAWAIRAVGASVVCLVGIGVGIAAARHSG